MKLQKETVLSYDNFNLLSNDIIELGKEILPDKVIYINFLNNNVQVTMKVSKHDTKVNVVEGDTIPVEEAVCNNINYKDNLPLILEDIKNNNFNEKVNKTIKDGNLGSYLGVPILFKNGKRFGALCAAHHDKGKFDQNDINLLEKIANLFSYYLELERQAHIDSLTGLENAHFLSLKQDEIIKNGGLAIMIDLDNFKQVNDKLGHYIGDLVLKEMGKKITDFGNQFEDCYTIRVGGDEFLIFIKDKLSLAQINQALKSLNENNKKWKTNVNDINLSLSIGAYQFAPGQIKDFKVLYQKVDSLLYKAKNEGKDTFVFE